MKKAKNGFYYEVTLDIILKSQNKVVGHINISHINYDYLNALFADQVTNERFLFDDSISYQISKELYVNNKFFLDKNIPFYFDFNLFEYWVSLSGDVITNKPQYFHTKLPKYFEK